MNHRYFAAGVSKSNIYFILNLILFSFLLIGHPSHLRANVFPDKDSLIDISGHPDISSPWYQSIYSSLTSTAVRAMAQEEVSSQSTLRPIVDRTLARLLESNDPLDQIPSLETESLRPLLAIETLSNFVKKTDLIYEAIDVATLNTKEVKDGDFPSEVVFLSAGTGGSRNSAYILRAVNILREHLGRPARIVIIDDFLNSHMLSKLRFMPSYGVWEVPTLASIIEHYLTRHPLVTRASLVGFSIGAYYSLALAQMFKNSELSVLRWPNTLLKLRRIVALSPPTDMRATLANMDQLILTLSETWLSHLKSFFCGERCARNLMETAFGFQQARAEFVTFDILPRATGMLLNPPLSDSDLYGEENLRDFVAFAFFHKFMRAHDVAISLFQELGFDLGEFKEHNLLREVMSGRRTDFNKQMVSRLLQRFYHQVNQDRSAYPYLEYGFYHPDFDPTTAVDVPDDEIESRFEEEFTPAISLNTYLHESSTPGWEFSFGLTKTYLAYSTSDPIIPQEGNYDQYPQYQQVQDSATGCWMPERLSRLAFCELNWGSHLGYVRAEGFKDFLLSTLAR